MGPLTDEERLLLDKTGPITARIHLGFALGMRDASDIDLALAALDKIESQYDDALLTATSWLFATIPEDEPRRPAAWRRWKQLRDNPPPGAEML